MRQFSTGGTYINFLTEDEGDDRTRAAYRTNYERLAQVKAAWDPTNLFRTNKNIGAGRRGAIDRVGAASREDSRTHDAPSALARHFSRDRIAAVTAPRRRRETGTFTPLRRTSSRSPSLVYSSARVRASDTRARRWARTKPCP